MWTLLPSALLLLLSTTARASDPLLSPRLSMACQPDQLECNLPSLGRMVSIGHGWDVRADQSVSGMTPWTPGTIEEMTSDWDNQQKEVFFEKETDSSQRDERLDIEANLGVNVLSGLVSVEAGGKYMTEEKMTSTSVRFVLDYDARHHFTSFDFLPPVDLPDFCSSGHLAEDGSPTHVVTSVQYGTKAFILFICDFRYLTSSRSRSRSVLTSSSLTRACRFWSISDIGQEMRLPRVLCQSPRSSRFCSLIYLLRHVASTLLSTRKILGRST